MTAIRTSTKRRVAIRQAINERLGARHLANSCDFCRKPLPEGYVLVLGANGPRKFCDTNCEVAGTVDVDVQIDYVCGTVWLSALMEVEDDGFDDDDEIEDSPVSH
jgi:hypothetical protein